MSLPDVSFIKGKNGNGRPLQGEDFISGIGFYSNTYPSGFSAANQVIQCLSLADAENAGIDNSYADETKATATITITTAGATGNVLTITVAEPLVNGGTNLVTLCTYAVPVTSTTVTAQATDVVAAIAAGNTGYTATNVAGVITITARQGLGIGLNTGIPLTVAATQGTGTSLTLAATPATPSSFTGGIASSRAIWHYHIAEYFRIQPQGNLYAGVFPIPGTYSFAEALTIQSFANGKCRQIAFYKETATTAANVTSDLSALQVQKLALDGLHTPCSFLYGANIKAIANLTTLQDQSTNTAYGASVVIAQDGAAKGAYLYLTSGKSITAIGACLGAVSLSAVNEDIAWAEKFDMTDGSELNTIAFANGNLITALSANALSTLNAYRYLFLVPITGLTGSYWNDNHTSISVSSPYAYINDNRTIDKAIRTIYATIRPKVASPLLLNADGTLTNATIEYFTSAADTALDSNMVQGKQTAEISAHKCTIDATQNVNATGKLVMACQLEEDGVARNIQVNIGYVSSI